MTVLPWVWEAKAPPKTTTVTASLLGTGVTPGGVPRSAAEHGRACHLAPAQRAVRQRGHRLARPAWHLAVLADLPATKPAGPDPAPVPRHLLAEVEAPSG